MEQYKKDFIDFMVRSKVLTFGDFTTKSGRKTPFFINTGNYKTGEQLARLGTFYAQAIIATLGKEFDVLFGPAYKGIPLAVATAMTLSTQFGHNTAFCFNRKEAKDHGEGGTLIGHTLRENDRIVIIEDVITAGTSIRESVPFLMSFVPVQLKGLVISVDRMEKGTGDVSALQEVEQSFGLKAFAIVRIDEIVEYLHNRPIDGTVVLTDELKTRVEAYRAAYGVK